VKGAPGGPGRETEAEGRDGQFYSVARSRSREASAGEGGEAAAAERSGGTAEST
jgi:hypothetical protein